MLKGVTGSAVINHLKQEWCHYLQIFKWVFRIHLSGWDYHLVKSHKFSNRNKLCVVCVCLMINKWVILSCVLPWAYARKPREINITIQPFISSIEFLTVMQWGMRNEKLFIVMSVCKKHSLPLSCINRPVFFINFLDRSDWPKTTWSQLRVTRRKWVIFFCGWHGLPWFILKKKCNTPNKP